MGKFLITKRKDGEFQFNLKAGNGQVILTSESYTTKDRKRFFNLKATNGQIIGTSEMYESVAGRDNGILSVMKNSPDATIEVGT